MPKDAIGRAMAPFVKGGFHLGRAVFLSSAKYSIYFPLYSLQKGAFSLKVYNAKEYVLNTRSTLSKILSK